MPWSLSFDVRKNYDTRQVGITLPVTLRAGGLSVDVAAKLDCGAANCIFARAWGEGLGLDIESGYPQRFSTVTGSFPAYGHEVVMQIYGIEIEAMVFFAADEGFDRDVLGLTGFIDRVQLGLLHYASEIYLSRRNGNQQHVQ
jgi:hypothetical protein